MFSKLLGRRLFSTRLKFSSQLPVKITTSSSPTANIQLHVSCHNQEEPFEGEEIVKSELTSTKQKSTFLLLHLSNFFLIEEKIFKKKVAVFVSILVQIKKQEYWDWKKRQVTLFCSLLSLPLLSIVFIFAVCFFFFYALAAKPVQKQII